MFHLLVFVYNTSFPSVVGNAIIYTINCSLHITISIAFFGTVRDECAEDKRRHV